ncbi:Hypothetical protein, no similarity [Geotrichum candidum]|uniref:Mid2 domain-containing protein n=1 Tax=Geotrichum candidum TaxID=1173061 RepID=A0A0J9XFJ5_GEOCN|nr:Hypothetical protein, no similarity [Geotrichum candidum]
MSSEQPANDAAVTVEVFATSTVFFGENDNTASPTSAAAPADSAVVSSGSPDVGEPTTTTAPNAEQSSSVEESPSQQGSSDESNPINSQPTTSENSNVGNNESTIQPSVPSASATDSVVNPEISNSVSPSSEATPQSSIPIVSTDNSQPSSTPTSLSDDTQPPSTTDISSQGSFTSVSETSQEQQSSLTSLAETSSTESLEAASTEVIPSTTAQATSSFETSSESVNVFSSISTDDSADTTVTFVITSTSTVQPTMTSESSTTSSQNIQMSSISSTSSLSQTGSSAANTAAASSSGTLVSGTPDDNGGGLSKGGTIGIAVAVPVGVILIALVLGFFLWKRHKNAKAAKSQRLAEVNDYSFNPNNSNTGLNIPPGSGGGGGAAAFAFNGATTTSDAGGSKATSSNYRGWGPTPKSPQMEQIPGGAAFPTNSRGAGVATSAAASAALARHGSSSEGEQSTHQRGSEELMIPPNLNMPSSSNTHGDEENLPDPHSSTYYPPYNPNRPQLQFSQQHDLNGFDFDDLPQTPSPAARYFNEGRSESPTQQRQLHIKNVAARRDSPKIEYSSWPDLQHESSSGTHGVSQNF